MLEMETAVQIASFFLAIAALVLGIVAIWLSLYFYRRSNDLYNLLTNIISRIEASTKVTEVASKDIIRPIIQTIQEMVQNSTRGQIDSLRPSIIQRSAASLDDALRGIPEAERSKVRQAVIAEVDSVLGTLKHQVKMDTSPLGSADTPPSVEPVGAAPIQIPGLPSYDWIPFVRRVRDVQFSHKFLSVKMLREKVFENNTEYQEALQMAIDRKMLLTHYIDNPKNPRFPTLVCELNPEHQLVKNILKAIERT